MDELTLLRGVREDVAGPTPDALARGRTALFERVTVPVPRHNKRRGLRIGGLSALGAGVVVTALVLTNVLGFAGWRGGADAAAAEALHAAALATIKSTDPVVAPGQYLLVHTTAVNMATIASEDGSTSSLLFESSDDLYIPADRDDDWIWSRQPSTVYKTFGPKSEAAAKGWTDDRGTSVELLQAKAGAFYGGQPSGSFGDLSALPRDPSQLLNYIYRVTLGSGPSPDGEALVFIADRLRLGIVQADLRAAFYEAAARIPGVEITERQATLDGRTGVAFGRDEGGIFRQEIIIDPTTGQFIGERMVLLVAQDEVPAGTTTGWSAVSTSVVDSAPQGGTPNGMFDVMGCISDGKGGSQCPTTN